MKEAGPVLLKSLLRENYKTQQQKFVAAGFPEKLVKSYLERFRKIRDAKYKVASSADIAGVDVPKGNSRFDIDRYKDFHQVERFVDYVAGQVQGLGQKGTKFNDIEFDAKPIGQRNGIEIYYAKDKEACIKYKGNHPYSWCISRDDAGNMYNTYRYKFYSPTFYFVKDVEATKEEFSHPYSGEFKNPWHFFVVQKLRDKDSYLVTSANNDGDNEMSWSDILEICPKLEGLEEYFKHVPISPEERRTYDRFINGVSDDEFSKLSYQEKSAYLDIALPNNDLTDSQFFDLPDELKNKFVGFGLGVSTKQLEYVKKHPGLYKRLYQVTVRKIAELDKSYASDAYQSVSPGEWLVLVYSPNAKNVIGKFKEEKILAMAAAKVNFDKVLDAYGKDNFTKLAQNKIKLGSDNFYARVMSQYDNENRNKVARFIGEDEVRKMTIWNLTDGSYDQNTTKPAAEFILQFRDLVIEEAEYLLNRSSEQTFDLVMGAFKDGRIKKRPATDPFGDESDYPDLAAKLLKFTGRFHEIVQTFPPEYLREISDEHRTGLLVFYMQTKYELVDELIDATGGVAAVQKLPAHNILRLLRVGSTEKLNKIREWVGEERVRAAFAAHPAEAGTFIFNSNRQTMPLLVNLIGRETIDKISVYNLAHIVSRAINPKDSATFYDIRFLVEVLGKNIVSKISAGTFSELVDRHANDITREEFLDTMWEVKKDNYTGSDQLSDDAANDISVFLAYSEDVSKYFQHIGDRIRDLSVHEIYSIFRTRLYRKNIGGPETISKLIYAFGPALNRFSSGALYDLFVKVYPFSILEALATTVHSLGPRLIVQMITNVYTESNITPVKKLISALGERFTALGDDNLGYFINNWAFVNNDLMFDAVAEVIGYGRALSLVNDPERKERLKRDAATVNEILEYRNFFI